MEAPSSLCSLLSVPLKLDQLPQFAQSFNQETDQSLKDKSINFLITNKQSFYLDTNSNLSFYSSEQSPSTIHAIDSNCSLIYRCGILVYDNKIVSSLYDNERLKEFFSLLKSGCTSDLSQLASFASDLLLLSSTGSNFYSLITIIVCHCRPLLDYDAFFDPLLIDREFVFYQHNQFKDLVLCQESLTLVDNNYHIVSSSNRYHTRDYCVSDSDSSTIVCDSREVRSYEDISDSSDLTKVPSSKRKRTSSSSSSHHSNNKRHKNHQSESISIKAIVRWIKHGKIHDLYRSLLHYKKEIIDEIKSNHFASVQKILQYYVSNQIKCNYLTVDSIHNDLLIRYIFKKTQKTFRFYQTNSTRLIYCFISDDLSLLSDSQLEQQMEDKFTLLCLISPSPCKNINKK